MTRRAWICGKAERACGRAARALLSLSEVFRRAGGVELAPAAEDEAALPEEPLPEVPSLEGLTDAGEGVPIAGSVAARLRAGW